MIHDVTQHGREASSRLYEPDSACDLAPREIHAAVACSTCGEVECNGFCESPLPQSTTKQIEYSEFTDAVFNGDKELSEALSLYSEGNSEEAVRFIVAICDQMGCTVGAQDAIEQILEKDLETP